MRLSRPFIQLPFRFEVAQMANEVSALPEAAWMAHPSGMKGNSAVALISRDAGDNDDFDGAMQVTPHLQRCPAIMHAMASFGEVLGRSRLMRLAPGSEVALHVDFNYHWTARVRMHIPLVTNPGVRFQCGKEVIHMAAGECWIFDSWRRHRVVNEGSEDRVHLVIDTSGSSRFWRTVRAVENGQAPEPVLVEFSPNTDIRIETERYNTAPVMAPGEVDGLIAELVQEFSDHPENDPGLVMEYRQVLHDFSKDWRAAWYRFGYRKAGWPHYQHLLEILQSSLRPNPRALVTRSNEVGVNPVIIQRIIRAALSVEHFDQLIGEAWSDP